MATSAKDRALRLLGVRSRSREELRRRLARAGYPDEEIAAALIDLERVGLVDDAAFARELAAHRLRRQGHGPRAALSALLKAGVARDVAERAIEEADLGDEESRAEEVAQGRAARLAGLPPEIAHRRLLAFLLRRGFDPEASRAACARALAPPSGDAITSAE